MSFWYTCVCSFILYIQILMSPCVLLQIVIASIMCSYNKEDWTELAKMAEVKLAVVKIASVRYSCWVLWTNAIRCDSILQLTEDTQRCDYKVFFKWKIMIFWEPDAADNRLSAVHSSTLKFQICLMYKFSWYLYLISLLGCRFWCFGAESVLSSWNGRERNGAGLWTGEWCRPAGFTTLDLKFSFNLYYEQ